MDNEKLATIGTKLRAKFTEYDADRQPLEQQWLRNFRQFRGVYDADILSKIPAGRSKVYPLDTQVKVLGFVAKIMELMFPANEKNWSVSPSPVPDINQSDIQAIIDGLQERAQEEQREVTNSDIEDAVFRYAEDRARAMERECSDQLSEAGYTTMARKALRSGGMYGFGVTKGPLVEFRMRRSWKFNEEQSQYQAETTQVPVPYYEHCKVWDLYPDLSATSWAHQEGLFERVVFSRNDLHKLTDDEAFDGALIRKFVRENPEGNHKPRPHETELANTRHGQTAHKDLVGRHYEVMRWYGFMSGADMSAAGIDVPTDKMDRDVLMDIWLLDEQVIRANVSPFGENVHEMYHAFIAEDDEEVGITGIGMPEKLRDTQLKLCSIDRMTMDNAATSAGPIFEVNDDLIKRGQDTDTIHSFKVIHREGVGAEAGYPAIRDINVNSHINDLISLRRKVQEQMDVESNLPSFLFGNTEGMGEAFRTTSNMSMLQGGAMMVTKDVIRSFDRWIESVIGSLYEWNMEFNDKTSIKGDFQVMARGTNSLVAKELRGIALDQFIQTLDDDDKQLLKRREVLIDRLQARDLPVDRVVDIEEAEQIMANIKARNDSVAQAEIAKDAAQTGERQASAQLKTAQAESLAVKTPIQNEESIARINQGREQSSLARTKEEREAVGQLLDVVQREQGGGQ